MQFTINKITYNVLEIYPDKEKISVSITAKFGVSNEDNFDRVFFLELNLEGQDKENGNETRSLNVVASLNYQLDKTLFTDLDDNQIDEDNTYLLELLKRVNSTVKSITTQDDAERTLNIDKAIKNFS